MEKLLATVERLRLKEGYIGSIHLKLIPGASYEYIEWAVELADRVSLNLEAPNQTRLNDLAPDKEFAERMWGRLAWAAELMKRACQEGRTAVRSMTTQFVVGAVGESDRELLETVQRAHRELGLWRAYFSAFHPSSAPRLPMRPPKTQRVRYGSTSRILCCGTMASGTMNCCLTHKGCCRAIRRRRRHGRNGHLHEPIELNCAPHHLLLRVPGIGPKSADRIIAARRHTRLRDLTQLKALGVTTSIPMRFVCAAAGCCCRSLSA